MKSILALSLLAVVTTATTTTSAEEIRTVTKAVLRVNHPKWTGTCPVKMEFVATLTLTKAAKITYSYERSDGAKSEKMEASLGKGINGLPVYTWQLGSAGSGPFDGWVKVHVHAPTGLESMPSSFKLSCK